MNSERGPEINTYQSQESMTQHAELVERAEIIINKLESLPQEYTRSKTFLGVNLFDSYYARNADDVLTNIEHQELEWSDLSITKDRFLYLFKNALRVSLGESEAKQIFNSRYKRHFENINWD